MASSTRIANIARIETVATILDETYGPRRLRPTGDPVTELVAMILSQNTSDINSGRAWTSLRERFSTWDAVRLAPTEAVADAIRSGGLADRKAPRIQAALESIREHRDDYDLSFLLYVPLDEAMAWLTDLDGIGPKSAACVLLFSLGRPAMPVDTHVHRVSRRLGIVPARTSPAGTQVLLERVLGDDAQRVYAFHVEMIAHGRALCRALRPRCDQCPLRPHCTYGQHHGGGPDPGPRSAQAPGPGRNDAVPRPARPNRR